MEHVVAPFTNVPGAVWTSAMSPVEVRRALRSRWCQAECSGRCLDLDGHAVRSIHPRLVLEDLPLSNVIIVLMCIMPLRSWRRSGT